MICNRIPTSPTTSPKFTIVHIPKWCSIILTKIYFHDRLYSESWIYSTIKDHVWSYTFLHGVSVGSMSCRLAMIFQDVILNDHDIMYGYVLCFKIWWSLTWFKTAWRSLVQTSFQFWWCTVNDSKAQLCDALDTKSGNNRWTSCNCHGNSDPDHGFWILDLQTHLQCMLHV